MFPRIPTAEPRPRSPPDSAEPNALSETLQSGIGNISAAAFTDDFDVSMSVSFQRSGSLMGQSPPGAVGIPLPAQAESPTLDRYMQAMDSQQQQSQQQQYGKKIVSKSVSVAQLQKREKDLKVPARFSVESLVEKISAPTLLMTRRDALIAFEDETLAKSKNERFHRKSSQSKFQRSIMNKLERSNVKNAATED